MVTIAPPPLRKQTPAPVARLPLLPALDGLRALAVTAVLLYHAEVRAVPGGFLGVESFFVVSGYLITGLLWTEAVSTDRMRLPRFWARRARRLLPALGVTVFATTAGVLGFYYAEMAAKARGEIVAAATYVSNWYLVFARRSYFEEAGRPSPFRHLWSLAVEEQFYLLFPLLFGVALFLVGRRARRVAVLFGAAAALSTVEMWVLYRPGGDPSRVYYGTDTRAAGLLIGVTLALLWRPWERADGGLLSSLAGRPLPRAWPDALAAAGLAALAVAAVRFEEHRAYVYRGGIQLVAVATAAVIVGTTGSAGVLRRILGSAPLTAVGRRSYSLYLWHWPVYVATRPGLDVPWTAGPTLALRLVVTGALAELSYRFVEQPFRRGALGRAARRLHQTFATATPDRRSRLRRRWGAIAATTATILLAMGVAVVLAEPPPPLTALQTPDADFVATGVVSAQPDVVPGTEMPGEPTPTTTARPRTEVYAVGDSVMLGAVDAVKRAVPGTVVNAKVGRQIDDGIDIVRTLRARDRLPRVLVVHLGNNGGIDAGQLDKLLAAAGDVEVVLVTVKVTRRWEGPNNDVLSEAARTHPRIRLVDWKNLAGTCRGDVFFEDGTHLKPDGQACYAAAIASAVLTPWA